MIHNFKRLKICVINQIYVLTYISVSGLEAYFTFNNWLYTVASKKDRMSTVVDISALRVDYHHLTS